MTIGEFASRRFEYHAPPLLESALDPDPVVQFSAWIRTAAAEGLPQPNAMSLATADVSGRPSVRTVLMKEVDDAGRIVWYTNHNSSKGHDLAENPQAEVAFLWLDLHRQVRIAGTVAQSSDAVSDEYFASRPRGSQVAAWASPQSTVLPDRATLEHLVADATTQFAAGVVPRPPHCGCYELTPQTWEFWQGQPSRLHDRLRYSRSDGGWSIERIAP